jgi:hypothetical protein
MKDITSGFAIILFFWLATVLAGCSFQVGIDWQGKTQKDNRTYTVKEGVWNKQ